MIKLKDAETRECLILNPDFIISISESSRNDGTCYITMDGSPKDHCYRVVGSADYVFELLKEDGQDEYFRTPKSTN